MRTLSGTQMVRQSTVSNARKRRTVNIPNIYMPIVNNVGNISAQLDSLVLHRHAAGWLLLALDDRAAVLAAWSSCEAYQPLRTRHMIAERMRGHAIRLTERRRGDIGLTVYTNDASLLAPMLDEWTVRLYECGLLAQLQTLARKNITLSSERDVAPHRQRIPTYAEIRELDPSLTISEYREIYE